MVVSAPFLPRPGGPTSRWSLMSTVFGAGSVLQVRLVCQDAEQASINVLHFRATSVAGSPTDQGAADSLDAAISALAYPLLNNHATYNGIGVRIIFPSASTPEVRSTAGAGVGTGGADALPRQSAGLVTWLSNTIRPHGQGRMYAPFPPAQKNTTNGAPSGAYLASLTTLAAYLLAPIAVGAGGDTALVRLVIWNKATSVSTFATDLRVGSGWATQRRRGSYGRSNAPPF